MASLWQIWDMASMVDMGVIWGFGYGRYGVTMDRIWRIWDVFNSLGTVPYTNLASRGSATSISGTSKTFSKVILGASLKEAGIGAKLRTPTFAIGKNEGLLTRVEAATPTVFGSPPRQEVSH